MIVENYDTPGPLITENYRQNVLTGVTYSTSGHDRYKAGSCGGIVHGNFKTPNSWNYNITSCSDIKGTETIYDGMYRTVRRGALGNCDIAKSLLTKANASGSYNKALAKLYDKIRSDVDLSIDIYQGNQTVSMLSDLAEGLRSPTRTLAKAMGNLVKRGKIRRGSQFIADKWLEWQYGIKPTMSTIYSLCGEMVEIISTDSGLLAATSRAATKEPYPSVVKRGSWSSVYNVNLSGETEERTEIKILYTIGNSERNALSQFTSLNPVSFIYENIPYSFVLDWIIDVGGYLRMMETACMTGLQFHSGYKTTSKRSHIIATIKDVYTDRYRRQYIGSGSGWAHYVSCVRTPLGSMPKPSRPSLNISLGSQRLASAAALLRGFLK